MLQMRQIYIYFSETFSQCKYDVDCIPNAFCRNQQTCSCKDDHIEFRINNNYKCLRGTYSTYFIHFSSAIFRYEFFCQTINSFIYLCPKFSIFCKLLCIFERNCILNTYLIESVVTNDTFA